MKIFKNKIFDLQVFNCINFNNLLPNFFKFENNSKFLFLETIPKNGLIKTFLLLSLTEELYLYIPVAWNLLVILDSYINDETKCLMIFYLIKKNI